KNPLLKDYERGRIATEKFFQHAKETFQFDGSVKELELIWSEIFTPIKEHLLLVQNLFQHYPLALISNTNESHMRHLSRQHDFFTFFREKIYSHEVGHAKPAPEIYETALKRMKTTPETSLFIDDLEENVLAPAQMGWQTIHLKPGDSLQLALQHYELQGI
ncbi:MAG: HAD family phosphatase, partial [bacterium]